MGGALLHLIRMIRSIFIIFPNFFDRIDLRASKSTRKLFAVTYMVYPVTIYS